MKKVIIAGVVLVVLGIAFYGISPLFRNKIMNDLVPAPAPNTPSTENPSTDISVKIPIVATTAHPASGFVRVVKTNDDKTYIRYENYKTINGPDLQIWLAKDQKGTDYVNLGSLKATEGNINYEVPSGVNISDYHYVLTWCQDFSVLFNSADLSAIKK